MWRVLVAVQGDLALAKRVGRALGAHGMPDETAFYPRSRKKDSRIVLTWEFPVWSRARRFALVALEAKAPAGMKALWVEFFEKPSRELGAEDLERTVRRRKKQIARIGARRRARKRRRP